MIPSRFLSHAAFYLAIGLFLAALFSLILVTEIYFLGSLSGNELARRFINLVIGDLQRPLLVLSFLTLVANAFIAATSRPGGSTRQVLAIALGVLAIILFGLPSFFG